MLITQFCTQHGAQQEEKDLATEIDLPVPLKTRFSAGDLLMQVVCEEKTSGCLMGRAQTSGQDSPDKTPREPKDLP